MARHGRSSMPPPPNGNGGYEFEVVEVGPPVYITPPPEVKARGGLIPMGDGEGLDSRPAPLPELRARTINDVALNFEASFQLGLTRHALKDHESAITHLERSVALARQANDRRLLALALHSLSVVLQDAGRMESAIPLTEEIVRLSEASDDQRMLVRALVRHGSLLRKCGRIEEAAGVLERAVETVGVF